MADLRSKWPYLPWFGWRYDMTRATHFVQHTGYRLYMWGVMIPTGRDTGILLGVLRRERDEPEGSR